MKRTLLIVGLVALTMGASAQHVTPLTVELKSFQLDSIHAKYVNTPAAMLTELMQIQVAQDANATDLKIAEKQLKEEKEHLNRLNTTIKDAESGLKEMSKLYENEEKMLKKMCDATEKYSKKTLKSDHLNSETRHQYVEFLDAEKALMSDMLNEVNLRQKRCAQATTKVQTLKSNAAQFSVEIQQKELQFKQMLNNHTANAKTIDTEIKNTKAYIKAQK